MVVLLIEMPVYFVKGDILRTNDVTYNIGLFSSLKSTTHIRDTFEKAFFRELHGTVIPDNVLSYSRLAYGITTIDYLHETTRNAF